MHDEPTRRMDAPPPDRGRGGAEPGNPGGGMSNGTKALIAILVATVIGLGVALAVVAADGGDETTVSTPSSTVATTSSTTTTSVPTTTTTSSSTSPSTTSTTVPATTSTVTAPGTTTEGSGGIESP